MMTNEMIMDKYYRMQGKYTEKEIAQSVGITVPMLRKLRSAYLHDKYATQKEAIRLMVGARVSVKGMADKLGIPESHVRRAIKDLRNEGAIE